MFYRAHQFYRAIFSSIMPSDLRWAVNHLPPQAAELFLKQSRPEQRHAIDVARSIAKINHHLPLSEFHNLMIAALLHDCGKSMVSIRLWERVYVVLIQKAPRSLCFCLEKGNSIFSLPLKINTRHALWGAHLAERAGLNSEICLLIREHHNPSSKLGFILEQADNTH
ncbi:putative domain HDIG-containing protein [Desulfosporosinus orientis DSM 765]|uniref:Putative domain HDIG-containing protein n=1 Tax=Desulfosporosinus orientis (strain ATCC 19365 / DSM 765 / NCIMB 8382 / VKM B-1628 / Singapore I) TaxID=768706 RepID=G7WGU8_DESOD|nr:HD domain-containing protein [Desulfosporosinus orientis]AET68962.1 putative domain HDIG-containing protein [Desulfosporosinus orientis DSM 765]